MYDRLLFQQSYFLYLLIPLIIVTFILLRLRFVKDQEYFRKKRLYRVFIFVFRFFVFTALVLALSAPALEEASVSETVPKVKILVDKSASMDIYSRAKIDNFINELTDQDIVVEVESTTTKDSTNLGDEILKKLEPNSNLLVISDFQSNSGTNLEEVFLFATTINSKIYGLNLKQEENEFSVQIEGPSKVVADVENLYKIKILPDDKEVDLKITVNDKEVFKGRYAGTYELMQGFTPGSHRIIAEIDPEDHFHENDIFYKAVTVVDKPKVLYVSKSGTPFYDLIEPLYDVTVAKEIPEDLDDYYAVVLNNQKAPSDDEVERLSDFLEDNGMMVIGGDKSFEWGEYNSSSFMNLLPVGIGRAGKKKDVANIVIAIDSGVSAATLIASSDDEVSFVEVQKALALDLIDTLADNSRVGVIESNVKPSILQKPKELGPVKEELKKKVRELSLHDATAIRGSVSVAHEMIRLNRGSKNIILITDGVIGYYDQVETLKNIQKAQVEAIKVFTVGVGQEADAEFLQKAADLGGGKYFQTDEANRLNIMFGEIDSLPSGQRAEIFIYDTNHFITEDLEDNGKVYGFNSVYPKTSAQLLVTTMSGDPVVTVWRYGLGRVAVFSTDDGSKWASNLMSKVNSPVVIKTLNWVIGEPERKSDYVLDVPDMVQNRSAVITVRSKEFPESDDLSFFEEKLNVYKAYYVPTKRGFIDIMGSTAAVNYASEFKKLGLNSNIDNILSIAGGALLPPDAKSAVDTLKTLSVAETTKIVEIGWIFILLAIVIYLSELAFRRIYQIRMRHS